MITLDAAQTAAVNKLLAGPVIDARLELTSMLGGETLGSLTPSAGKVTWDGSERRGRLDVDAPTDGTAINPRHPLANFGQVLVANWVWPEIGVSVPCGRWLVAEPASRDGMLWQVAADPEGPARLARAGWWTPDGQVVSGTMAQQLNSMLGFARVTWVPTGAFGDRTVPATECAAGTSVLGDVAKVMDHAGVEMRPSRHTAGVEIFQPYATPGPPVWTWTAGTVLVSKVEGTPAPELAPNRVTVWCEEDIGGVRTVTGWSEPLYHGPRRWDGPYGQVPHVVKLDSPATADAMRNQARRTLRRLQESAATVRVVMRADPRVEFGDIARAINTEDGTDCLCRVTSVSLDAGTGQGVVEASVISGLVAGVPAATIES